MNARPATEVIASSVSSRGAASAGRRIWIAIGVVVGGLIVVNLVAQGLDRAVGGNQPGGATGSSYATAPDGLAAFGTLLSHFGHDVSRQRGPIATTPLPTDATAFVIEPSELTADDAAALLQFVTGGGQLVVGGESPFYLHNLRDRPPTWQTAGSTSWTTTDPALGNASDVEAAGTGSWSAPGSGTVLVGTGDDALVTRDHVGRGEITFLADASPLENGYLDAGDNAAFALALAGDAGRPVVFPEGVHGYGASRGLGAIPDRWKLALILVAVAAIAFVWSRARRFGPPDHVARDLPPARATYVEALSISLERTHDPARALAPAQQWARARLMTRAGLGPDADDDDVTSAARRYGCAPDEISALLAPVSDTTSILALGRAVARVGGGNGSVQ